MLILAPSLTYAIVAILLFVMSLLKTKLKYCWLVASSGALIGMIWVILWHQRLPMTSSIISWYPISLFRITWFANNLTWPIGISIAGLALAAILTSVTRQETGIQSWGSLFATLSLGIMTILANTPLTLAILWFAIDVIELITLLSRIPSNKTKEIIRDFTFRILGISVVLWVAAFSNISTGFASLSPQVTGYLLLACVLRLGIFSKEYDKGLGREYGTITHVVLAISCLIILQKIPTITIQTHLVVFILFVFSYYSAASAYLWFRASDEVTGRHEWIVSLSSLAIAMIFLGNPISSLSWSITLILSGGLLFLYSSRHRMLMWIPIINIWGASALPFSVSASGWSATVPDYWYLFIPLFLAQIFLLAGLFKHSLHGGDNSVESHPRWVKIIYLFGLMALLGIQILLGFWGWEGVPSYGIGWAPILAVILGIAVTWLYIFLMNRNKVKTNLRRPLGDLYRGRLVFHWQARINDILGFLNEVTINTLEGDNGILWSLLLLILLISFL
jgi:hypothetical protein